MRDLEVVCTGITAESVKQSKPATVLTELRCARGAGASQQGYIGTSPCVPKFVMLSANLDRKFWMSEYWRRNSAPNELFPRAIFVRRRRRFIKLQKK